MQQPVVRLLWLLPLLCLLGACGGGALYAGGGYASGSTVYPEPGPPDDPWRPYIRQAADRFTVPQRWIRAVMRQESGGHEYRHGQPITSGAGAMGLMQLMPATYADLQVQYDLGSDPYEPRDNIMAGTAYIRQMYQRYGAPAFLAAYNAGPQRLEDYLYSGRSLPNETIDYVAAIAPSLGTEIAMSGPLAAYAGGGGPVDAAPVQLAAYRPARRGRRAAAGCWHDPDTAYDPDSPCRTAPVQVAAARAPPIQPAIDYRPAPSALAYRAAAMDAASGCARDPDAAYDAPCGVRPAIERPPIRVSVPMAAPARMPRAPVVLASAPAYGHWAIQVGAYASEGQARFATTMARQADYRTLAGSQSVVQATAPFGRGVLYRARLAGLARGDAGSACAALRTHDIPCMVVTPGG